MTGWIRLAITCGGKHRMKPPQSGPPSGPGRTPSANDRFKASWTPWLLRSTALAAVLHGAAFSLWPSWERSRTERDSLQEFLQLEWVSVLEASSAPSPEPLPAVRVGNIPDSVPTLGEVVSVASGTGTTIATLSEAFRDRLIGRGALTPTISETEELGTEEPVDEADAGGGGDGTIDARGGLADAQFSELMATEPIDLGRLSAVRPELVLSAPSAWVLLRNPREVEQFLLRSYRRGVIDRADRGSVSVALWIDNRGAVEWAEISESSGRAGIDRVALELFTDVAAFRPAREEGVTVPRSVIFSLRFPWY